MTETTIHLLRHGEVHNPTGVLYGRLPGYGLSKLGQAMAERIARHVAGRDIAAVIASPLQRAQETAAPIAAALGLPIGADERLLEAENRFEGLTFGVGDGSLRHPRLWPLLRNPFRPSWGEPYREIAERVLAAARAARDGAIAAGSAKHAVCVSHQLPIVIARRAAEGRRLFHDPRKRECNLASVTTFTFDGDDIVDIAYAEPAATLPPGHGAGA